MIIEYHVLNNEDQVLPAPCSEFRKITQHLEQFRAKRSSSESFEPDVKSYKGLDPSKHPH